MNVWKSRLLNFRWRAARQTKNWTRTRGSNLSPQLPFGMSSFCKYALIGDDPRLTDPEKRHVLPAKMSAIYELHQLTDDEFPVFEAEGLLTPGLRRADVIRWISKRRGEPQKPTLAPKLPGTFYAALKPNRQLADTEISKIDDDLAALAERFEMEVVYPEAKPRKGIWEKAQGQIRREAKKIVGEYFRRRRKEIGRNKFASRPHLQKYAGFVADDVEIEPDADEDRIFAVLEAIGLERRVRAHQERSLRGIRARRTV